MEEKRYRLSGPAALSVPLADADRLLALGDGECALLYLYILRCGGALSLGAAARPWAGRKRTWGRRRPGWAGGPAPGG